MNSPRIQAIVILAIGSLCGAIAANAQQPPGLAEGEATFDAKARSELKVLRAKTGHLLVRPTINGVDAGWFIFDTGAGICVVSTPHVEKLQLTEAGAIDAVGVAGSENARLYRAATMVLGPMTLKDQPAITTDLSFLKAHLGEEVAGVIGYGVLVKCIAEIDLKASRIGLHDPARFKLPAGGWTDMSLDNRIPTVTAKFEEREGRFRLDTGANETVTFYEPAVKKWDLLKDRTVSDAKLGGVGGFVATKQGTVKSFEVGGLRRENVKATFATQAKGTQADASVDGSIGGGLLNGFVLVLDYAGERIAFQPRTEAAQSKADGSPAARLAL